jgi:hypothetical protein
MVWTRGQQASECEFWKESKYTCTHAGTSVARSLSIEKGIVARGSDITLKKSGVSRIVHHERKIKS